LGAYGVSMGMAAVIGQALGGALVQWNPFGLGWRAGFLLKLPFCLLIIRAAALLVPETSPTQPPELDLPGAGPLSLALAGVIVPLSEGRDQGWPIWVFAIMALVPALIAGFLRQQAGLARQGGMPLVDLRLFAIPSFRRGVLVGTLFFFTTAFYFLFG